MSDHLERIRAAALAHHLGQPHDDHAATARVQEIEEEIALMQAFNGYDGLQAAKAQYGLLVDEVREYLRAQKAAGVAIIRLAQQSNASSK